MFCVHVSFMESFIQRRKKKDTENKGKENQQCSDHTGSAKWTSSRMSRCGVNPSPSSLALNDMEMMTTMTMTMTRTAMPRPPPYPQVYVEVMQVWDKLKAQSIAGSLIQLGAWKASKTPTFYVLKCKQVTAKVI